MSLEVHHSSKTVEWSTPQEFFDDLNRTFKFDLDACATHENALCDRYFTKEDDALAHEWKGTIWMNPPYGAEIASFMAKALDSASKHGSTVVCLVPARTDTRWWHDYAIKGTVLFLKGRLKFGGAKTDAPFPSAVVIFWGGVLGGAA